MTVNTAYDVRLLEDLFSEPHCTATHASPYNRECTHKVTHHVEYPCGCTDEACANQVRYLRWAPTVSISMYCPDCPRDFMAEDCVITPRVS